MLTDSKGIAAEARAKIAREAHPRDVDVEEEAARRTDAEELDRLLMVERMAFPLALALVAERRARRRRARVAGSLPEEARAGLTVAYRQIYRLECEAVFGSWVEPSFHSRATQLLERMGESLNAIRMALYACGIGG